MKNTKVVCTIGPASDNIDVLREMAYSGMNVCRLNFSHGTHKEHQSRIDNIKKLRKDINIPLAIMLDTKGPEIRIGLFKDKKVQIKKGQSFILRVDDITGDEKEVSVSYKELAKDLKVGDRVLMDDGIMEFYVEEIKSSKDIVLRAVTDGELKDQKGVNIPGIKVGLPSLTEKDIEDIKFGIKNDIDFIAASFIRSKDDVLKIRAVLEENGAQDIMIISKIENREGLDNIDEILDVSDGIMVARGDLGVEIDPQDIPLEQKKLIRKCNLKGKVVITATQMLDSMTRNKRPTRAEVTDVANAILDGSGAIMLSGETAAGLYPVEAVKMMGAIAEKTENSPEYENMRKSFEQHDINVTNAIAYAATNVAEDLNVKAIIASTASGITARSISKFRPRSVIIAASAKEKVRRQLFLEWGVYPVESANCESTDKVFDSGVENALKSGYIKEGDMVVLTAGVPVGLAGTTNIVMVRTVGKLLFKGTGIGDKEVTARVCLANTKEEFLENFKDGDIVVTIGVYKDMVSFIERAVGLITVEGGLTSHGAIVGLNLGIPTIVGAQKALEELKNGDLITMDAKSGLVYKGDVKISGDK